MTAERGISVAERFVSRAIKRLRRAPRRTRAVEELRGPEGDLASIFKNHSRSLFADHDGRRVGIARCDRGHGRRVRNT